MSESPNPAIDKAIEKLMKKVDSEPPDVGVKIIAQAISWEKVKHQIVDSSTPFDPDDI